MHCCDSHAGVYLDHQPLRGWTHVVEEEQRYARLHFGHLPKDAHIHLGQVLQIRHEIFFFNSLSIQF